MRKSWRRGRGIERVIDICKDKKLYVIYTKYKKYDRI